MLPVANKHKFMALYCFIRAGFLRFAFHSGCMDAEVEIHRSHGPPLNDYYVDLQIKEFFSWDVWRCNFENTARNIHSSTALESYRPLLSNEPSIAIIRAVLAMIQYQSLASTFGFFTMKIMFVGFQLLYESTQ